MKAKTKNIISVILPLITIFTIAFIIRIQPTGFVVYEDKILYKLNGSININLEERIPVDSYIRIKIDEEVLNINLIEFLKKSGKMYRVMKDNNEGYIIGEGVYSVDFSSLGITWGFEKGRHVIKTDIVCDDRVLYNNEEVVTID